MPALTEPPRELRIREMIGVVLFLSIALSAHRGLRGRAARVWRQQSDRQFSWER